MAAAVENIVIEVGSRWERTATVSKSGVPFPLTGYNARMMIREHYEDASPLVTLTSPSNGLTVNESAGTVDIVIKPSVTNGITAKFGFYDLEVLVGTDEDSVYRVLRGAVTFSPQATH